VGDFEPRWRDDAMRIKTFDEQISPNSVSGEVHVIFDNSHVVDCRHHDEINNLIEITSSLPLMYSGHSSIRALADVDLLSALLHTGANGRDPKDHLNEIAGVYFANRHRSPTSIIQEAESMSIDFRRYFLKSAQPRSSISQHMKAFEDYCRRYT
ncbi:hypothetical protein, partial [Brevundimonas nasdae]|uniref:hypothetical protein n=1 Tax=Brevundimonas nasdae TaxID=172043 RepID=UPI003F6904C7